MTAPELRAFVHAVLDQLEDEQRTSRRRLVDGPCGEGPRGLEATPSVSANRRRREVVRGRCPRVGYADPGDVSEHLRLGTKAFLAGDHASARAVFEALLPPIAIVDIDLASTNSSRRFSGSMRTPASRST